MLLQMPQCVSSAHYSLSSMYDHDPPLTVTTRQHSEFSNLHAGVFVSLSRTELR
jgi:hypothetical protein